MRLVAYNKASTTSTQLPVGCLLLPHCVPATCRSLAQTSMSAEFPFGKQPTTQVRLRISQLSLSITLLVRCASSALRKNPHRSVFPPRLPQSFWRSLSASWGEALPPPPSPFLWPLSCSPGRCLEHLSNHLDFGLGHGEHVAVKLDSTPLVETV